MMYNNFMRPFDYNAFGFGPSWFFFGPIFIALSLIVLAAVVALKGYALWHAARRDEKWWFIALLVINTMGLLELFYLIGVAKVWFAKKEDKKSEADSEKVISA